MTRVVYYTAATLDGFIADLSDSLDWLFAVPDAAEAEAGIDAFMDRIGVLVEGSTTYEWVVGNDQLLEHPEKWAQFYANRPTFVFTSRSLKAVPGADIRFRSGAIVDTWSEIVAAAGEKDVWVVGGGDLAGQFADAGLLDEIVVSVAPVALGSGRALLPRRLESDRLSLEGVRRVGQFAELTYSVDKSKR
ncbi:putative dihydrofolate reductase [Microbacterium sp. C448]|uniref:dihydrofolate reductase family protein n=1 Tax=Microbacterium sp. C448 TaxID=1177594 RepID=UPI0003DE0307|nr:dihydrofolate reductase family protein [Microbacterium sp. C448]CDK00897.1 putative dihydrofolate reductase [Microbacterium sp. C448]